MCAIVLRDSVGAALRVVNLKDEGATEVAESVPHIAVAGQREVRVTQIIVQSCTFTGIGGGSVDP